MESIADKLSRVSALRPSKRACQAATLNLGASADPDMLIRLLDGENCINRLGSCIRVRRYFAEPRAVEVCARALQLLLSDTSGIEDVIFDLKQWLFLDTETTGLAGGTGTYAFLVGIAWWENDRFVVEQYFMRNHSDEASLLLELLQRLDRQRVLITFNGKSFDWPLLQTRFQMRRMKAKEPFVHLDLLYPSRQLWRLHLQSVALKQLERHVLRLDRGHDIPSETIPQRYFDFLRGGPAELMTEVFYHNQWDLCGLASLALHITRLLEDPERSGCCGGELFGISRLLQRRGETHAAAKFYQKAIEYGLPKAAEQIAQRELALLAKHRHDFELSNAFWEKLLGDSTEGLRAYEQLAIYYEHTAKTPQRAVLLSREALAQVQRAFHEGRIAEHGYMLWHSRFRHRLNRLTAKMARSSCELHEA